MKTIALNKKETENILADIEAAIKYSEGTDEDFFSHSRKLGYCESTLKLIKRKLTGEYPIVTK